MVHFPFKNVHRVQARNTFPLFGSALEKKDNLSKCVSRLDAVHILAIGVKGNLCKNVGGCLRLLSCRIWPANWKVKKRRKSVSRLHRPFPRWPPLVSCSCKIMHFSFSACFGTLICIDCVHRLYLRWGFLSKCARRLRRKHDSSGGHQDLGLSVMRG